MVGGGHAGTTPSRRGGWSGSTEPNTSSSLERPERFPHGDLSSVTEAARQRVIQTLRAGVPGVAAIPSQSLQQRSAEPLSHPLHTAKPRGAYSTSAGKEICGPLTWSCGGRIGGASSAPHSLRVRFSRVRASTSSISDRKPAAAGFYRRRRAPQRPRGVSERLRRFELSVSGSRRAD